MPELEFVIICQLHKSTVNEAEVFKKTLKRFLLDNSFYSVDEFFIFKELGMF